ncbi:unnamed protein product [Rhizoctonia solani]|uniref:Uncharacterized protein n=1 Tax=Rhizoctonia solani TaxID=456999 RepID=A0A8H3HSH1_9AGAM|nr:unnamed protein product [Rhizoctonia solani]
MATATVGGKCNTVGVASALILTFLGALSGIQTTLQGLTEGLANAPKLYGSEVRDSKKVTGLASGLVEGTKGLVYGIYDGFTDLVREPVKGYKDKGALGAVTGFGTGALNLYLKPIAGMCQIVSMPMEGGVKDIRGLFHKDISQVRVAVRHGEGILAVKQASQRDQDAVVQAFAQHNVRMSHKRKGKGKLLK